MTADQFLAALRAEGCQVREYRSWRTHHRNRQGPWGSVHGVMIHHTASSGSLASVELCYDGRPGLPLRHSVGTKDGLIYMVGQGRANHAGLGIPSSCKR
ncbi:hypothetical protein [Streptomyces sp. NPDC052496]|uniref:peptidoglycan recognition protein family protein n=1 Tax=Streptomyces sp. NPDC052496 TaxID=3154951 RepID=UPI003418416E